MRCLRFFTFASILFFANAVDAHAACTDLTRGLDEKMTEYRAHRDSNQNIRDSLLTVERDCKSKGEVISAKAAKLSDALSCTAQKDAHQLDDEIKSLSKKCEANFNSLKNIQKGIHADFDTVHDEMKDTMTYLQSSPLMKKYCGDELSVANTMSAAFLKLEGQVVDVEAKATTGEGEYMRLKEISASLAARTAKLDQDCGTNGTAAVKPAGGAKGQGSGVVAGKSPTGKSDLTGTKEAIEAEKKANEIINKQPK